MRLRVRYSKLGKVRFLSHRDLARVWERGLRRAGVRVAYSEGFSPRPRLSFGLALSTGYESLGEYLDIDLHAGEAVSAEELPALVTPALPPGIVAQVATPLAPGSDSLQAAVTSSSWLLDLPGVTLHAATAAVEQAVAAPELPIAVERKGTTSTIDARPAILALALSNAPAAAGSEGATVAAELATQPRSLRPAELIRALDPTWVESRVLRTHQWTSTDGARSEPIPFGEPGAAAATSVAHASERAS